jgi:hypothetical protein
MSQDVSIRTNPETVKATHPGTTQATSGKTISRWVVVGACLGLAWGVALRAWMVVLALNFGEQPKFTWRGTFGGILLPAVLVGAWLGSASYAAKSSGSKRWRWSILSPLLLAIGPAIVTENFISTLITTGMGGGAIGVALIGMLGGYALSGLGALWKRWVSGLLASLLTFATGVGFFLGKDASEAFGALYFILLMALLVLGVSAPFRYQSKQLITS